MPTRHTLLFLLLSCLTLHARDRDVTPPAVVLPIAAEEIVPAQVEAYLVEHVDAVIIDTRTQDERRTRGHILNSLSHDYFFGQKTLDALAQIDPTKPCILYCATGGRSKRLAIEMHKLGFKRLLVLKGGFNAWVADGQAVAK